jgi:hypothetical protein
MNLILKNDDIVSGREKRLERISEAISWEGGTQEKKVKHVIWEENDYEISLNKPGKEAASDYNRCRYKDGRSGNNPNDMLPTAKKGGEQSRDISFAEIFRDLLVFMDHKRAGEIFGALLVRAAYMVDHVKDEKGNWRYKPSKDALDELEKLFPVMYNISTRAFLHYLDALAWNEDVKYHTLGYDVLAGYGRVNNLMTYANLVAAAIGKTDFGQVIGGFARPPAGISAISRLKAFKAFPDLGAYEWVIPKRKKKT